MHQFNVDCHRVRIFIDDELIEPSTPPNKVRALIFEIFGPVTDRVVRYCTQIPLAKHYIEKVTDMQSKHVNEHLLSDSDHKVIIHRDMKMVTIKKNFIQSYIDEGENYDIDYCQLTILYNPILDEEVSVSWDFHCS